MIIDVDEWDSFVSKAYGGRKYSFQQQDGCKDRGCAYLTVPNTQFYDYEAKTIPEEVNGDKMGVKLESWLARDPKTPIKDQKYEFELRLWWERNFYPHVQSVANELHKRGLLEAGEYVIDINW